MQTEIRYRVWNSYGGEWVSDYHAIRADGTLLSAKSDYAYMEVPAEYADNFVIVRSTLYYDKNGKEIYSGDILRGEQETHAVVLDKKLLQWKAGSIPLCDFRKPEVIGSTYENPELLSNS